MLEELLCSELDILFELYLGFPKASSDLGCSIFVSFSFKNINVEQEGAYEIEYFSMTNLFSESVRRASKGRK
jgi:hypothetical protein